MRLEINIVSRKYLVALLVMFAALSTYAFADFEELGDDLSGPGGAIINKYLQATQDSSTHAPSMEVSIDASVPKLNQHGTLKALRKISNVGKVTYRVLGFQGDTTIKSQVIGRYLEAEQQTQDDKNMSVSPANYKFHFKGQKMGDGGHSLYVFQLTPRKKRMGLFKGELWLDSSTCLPVMERGRLVKNPSIFFKKVDFQRDFAIQNGSSVPAHMNSTIDTRLVGRVNLSVNYSTVALNSSEAEAETSSSLNSSVALP